MEAQPAIRGHTLLLPSCKTRQQISLPSPLVPCSLAGFGGEEPLGGAAKSTQQFAVTQPRCSRECQDRKWCLSPQPTGLGQTEVMWL